MVSTRPLVSLRTRLLPSFVYPSFISACFLLFAFLPHLLRPTRRLACSLVCSLARARESFALIAPHAQGDEVTVLFVCHPPATCFALLLYVRVREEKRQRATKRNGAKTYDSMQWKISIAYWTCKFDLSCEHSSRCKRKTKQFSLHVRIFSFFYV